jgi:hypothetical protein
MDTDETSVEACRASGLEATLDDALSPTLRGDEGIASFNLILHHLVGPTEKITRDLQSRALAAWREQVSCVFVNEYVYESYFPRLSGRLIFGITSSRSLSLLGRGISTLVPALRANTFGVGVRFRSHEEWLDLFASVGYDVVRVAIGAEERIALPRRLLLIKAIRRDSFLLMPRRRKEEIAENDDDSR